MSRALTGPGGRYRVAVEALVSGGGDGFVRRRAVQGAPLPDDRAFMVLLHDACSLVLEPGENGLTVRSVKLMNAASALITAVVTAGDGAPDWLPQESTYLLFQGDREAAAAQRERYFPLEGMTEGPAPADQGATPLDRLAVAVGRSVARANAQLARTTARGGVALVANITIRVAVEHTDVGQGRVLVNLARPGTETGQFVELTMTTVPGAEPEAAEEEGTFSPSPGVAASDTIVVSSATDPRSRRR